MLNPVIRESGRRAEVLESEHLFLELGATAQVLPGFRIVRAQGLESVAPGCVVDRADVTAAETDPQGWVATCESALERCAPSAYRVLLHSEAPRLDSLLVKSGYRKRLDTVFVSSDSEPELTALRLRTVETWPEWNLKCLSDRECCRAGDEQSDPFLWEELHRRKWVTGKFRCYLAQLEGQVVGTVSGLESGSLMRMKHLSIRPEFRGRGLGRQTVLAFWRLALEQGDSGIGALGRGPESAVLRAAGLLEAGWCAHYSKPRAV